MLIVVSGPDRVGKSTLIREIQDELGSENCTVYHHGPPDPREADVFGTYRKEIGQTPENKHIIFDRGWPCTFILEQLRKRNSGHFDRMVELEMWINEVLQSGVIHIGQFRPWNWSALLHLEELREEDPLAREWVIRDRYVERMNEHKQYTEQLMDFYEDITMFPNVTLTESVPGRDVLKMCANSLARSGQ